MELLTEKETLKYLGYSPKSNILALMRMKTKDYKNRFVPRHIKFNGGIRYPKEWLDEDINAYIQRQAQE
ncbi:hypothetical protein [Campylobacter ureolyticus]|uniref:hypothetical protein n=1 Tax=Campylobacter ureolyticus TaxID=827 RepID=UPI0022B38001|nr:hypothetical protein [Campylobacter ureolyticus]MCZ6102878.1 hypothetical protein [Campylobacter ureolyticus]